jgi:hypothetical protein
LNYVYSHLNKHYSLASHTSHIIYGVITPHASRSSWRDPRRVYKLLDIL